MLTTRTNRLDPSLIPAHGIAKLADGICTTRARRIDRFAGESNGDPGGSLPVFCPDHSPRGGAEGGCPDS